MRVFDECVLTKTDFCQLQVSYKQESTTLLGLEIPLESATNKLALEQYRERQQKRQKLKEEAGSVLEVCRHSNPENGTRTETCLLINLSRAQVDAERVLPRVPLNACLEKYAADELVEGYFSAFLGKNTEVRGNRSRVGIDIRAACRYGTQRASCSFT